MSHTDIIVKKQVGLEIERLFLSICAGMLQSAYDYERAKEKNEAVAIDQIKRAVDMPNRVKHRLVEFATNYTTDYLDECLVIAGGTITYSELQIELSNMKSYANDLVDAKQGGQTWGQISETIRSQVEDESLKYIVPFPKNYIDIWGE